MRMNAPVFLLPPLAQIAPRDLVSSNLLNPQPPPGFLHSHFPNVFRLLA
jgi:hypothetical protein